MKIINGKALLLKLRNPNRVTETIPKSKATGPHEVAVSWGVDEVQTLRSLGVKAPSPISGRYDWPGRYKPMDHQKTTAEFMTLHKKSFCFNEQGTGKTASAIWAADFLMKQGKVRRALIICPLSIMDSAWRADLFEVAMHRTVDVAHGDAKKRKQIINGGSEFVVINFDGVEIVEEDIRNGGFDLIIVGRGDTLQERTEQAVEVLEPAGHRRHLAVDDDWYAGGAVAARCLRPCQAGQPYRSSALLRIVRDQVMMKITQFKWMAKPGATEAVYNALQPAIRFTKEECLDLPDMTYVKRQVELTRQQKKYYNELKNKLVMEAAGEEVTAANAAIVMNKLLQISAGAVYTDDGSTLEFDIKNRYNVLREVIDESSQKVLVFVPFRHTIDVLVGKLRKDGFTTEVIRGDVPATKRTEIFKRFQETPDPKILVIQPQSAAHGVTLTAANTVVWWGLLPHSKPTHRQTRGSIGQGKSIRAPSCSCKALP
jgi:hypothetical protein